MKTTRSIPFILFMLILLSVTTGMRPLAPEVPLGMTINATTTTDEYDTTPNGTCSLREAVQSANNNADFGGCDGSGSFYGHDTIYLGTGTYLVNRGSGPSISEDANVYGDLDISPSPGGLTFNIYDVTIIGEGSGNTILDANNIDRVIDIQANAYVKLVGVKIYRGHPSIYDGKQNNGGGIYNHGTLRIEDCLIFNNWGQSNDQSGTPHIGDGGGVWSDGILTIVNSVLTTNRASVAYNDENGGDGGGIYIAAGSGTVLISNSTLTTNSAGGITEPGTGTGGRGGGIFNAGDDTRVENTTLDLNFAGQATSPTGNGGNGGGIYNYQGTITITNSTLYNNRAGYSDHASGGSGGGLVNNGGLVELHESTLVNNMTGTGVTNGSGGGIESTAANTTTRLHNTLLAWNANPGPPDEEQIKDCHTSGAGTNIFEARYSLIHDLTGCVLNVSESMLLEVNPGTGEMGYHGGITMTVPLMPGSLAIDAGDPADCPATDQRGKWRPVDGNNDGTATCDIGSYEVQLLRFLPLIIKSP